MPTNQTIQVSYIDRKVMMETKNQYKHMRTRSMEFMSHFK